MLKKLTSIICIVAILASLSLVSFAFDYTTIVPLTDFNDVAEGTLKNGTAFSNGWLQTGTDQTGEIVREADSNRYVKLTSTGSNTNEFRNNFTAIDDSFVKSIRISGKTCFGDSYLTRRIGIKGDGNTVNPVYFNTDKTVKVGNNSIENFEYQINVWYEFSMEITPTTGYIHFTMTSPEGKSYSQFATDITAVSELGRVTFVAQKDNSLSQSSVWCFDDMEIVYLPKLNEMIFEDNFDNKSTGEMPGNWSVASGTSAIVEAKSDSSGNYFKYIPATSSTGDLKYEFSGPQITEGIRLSFKTKFDGMLRRRIMLRSSANTYYIEFTKDGAVNVGNIKDGGTWNTIDGFKYETGVWYDVEINLNHNGYVNMILSDSVNIYKIQGTGASHTSSLTLVDFVTNKDDTGTCFWYLDDVALQKIDAPIAWTDYNGLSDISYSKSELGSGEISASVSGQIYGSDKSVTLYIALYNKSGKELVGVDVQQINASSKICDYTACVTVPQEYQDYEVRAFLFDASLSPVKTADVLQ